MAGGLGIAVACGMVKALVDITKSRPGPPRRKQPWEL
jgi:hypothetical protein